MDNAKSFDSPYIGTKLGLFLTIFLFGIFILVGSMIDVGALGISYEYSGGVLAVLICGLSASIYTCSKELKFRWGEGSFSGKVTSWLAEVGVIVATAIIVYAAHPDMFTRYNVPIWLSKVLTASMVYIGCVCLTFGIYKICSFIADVE